MLFIITTVGQSFLGVYTLYIQETLARSLPEAE